MPRRRWSKHDRARQPRAASLRRQFRQERQVRPRPKCKVRSHRFRDIQLFPPTSAYKTRGRSLLGKEIVAQPQATGVSQVAQCMCSESFFRLTRAMAPLLFAQRQNLDPLVQPSLEAPATQRTDTAPQYSFERFLRSSATFRTIRDILPPRATHSRDHTTPRFYRRFPESSRHPLLRHKHNGASIALAHFLG